MKAALFFPFTVVLGACEPSSQRDMEACHSVIRLMHATEPTKPSDESDEDVKACMTAKGYRFNTMPYTCGHGDPYKDAACYLR